VFSMAVVLLALAFGDQHFDALPDQFIAGVAEHSFGLRVDLNNNALLIDRSNGVGNRLQN
jgi:hypothetical protein